MSTYTERQLSKLLDEHVKDLKSLAGGWQAGTAKFADNQAYARGLGICAKQLYETIARLETLIADEREEEARAEYTDGCNTESMRNSAWGRMIQTDADA